MILNSVSLKSRDFGRRVHKIRVISLFMSYRQTALTLCLSINVNWFSLLKWNTAKTTYSQTNWCSWSIEITLNPFYIEMQNFVYSLWLMTASFKGKNPVTWLQAKSPLSFVFSSAFIKQLTKSLLEVCFRFIYLHFNKFRAHLLQGRFCLEFYFAPFLWAAYSCDHNGYKNILFLRLEPNKSLWLLHNT